MWRGKERGILLEDFLQLSHFPHKLGKWCNASICFPCTGPGWGLEGEAFQSLQGRHGRPHVPPTLIWCPRAVACHEGRVGHPVILPRVIREGGGMSAKKKQEKHLGRGGCHESGRGPPEPSSRITWLFFWANSDPWPSPLQSCQEERGNELLWGLFAFISSPVWLSASLMAQG